MTTIAYSKGSIACDSRMCNSSMIMTDSIKKVHVLTDGTHVAFAGSVGDIETFRRAMVDEGPFSIDDKYDFENVDAIAVTPDGKLFYFCDEFTNFVELKGREHFAIGSGGDFALGALLAGADLQKALEIAISQDSGSGGEIHIYDVTKPKTSAPVNTNQRVVPLRKR